MIAPRPTKHVAKFVDHRIRQLSGRRSQKEIAQLSGVSSSMISAIRHGHHRLPLEKAVKLAQALETDPSHLFRLAMEEALPEQIVADLRVFNGFVTSSNERAIIETIRRIVGIDDPPVTPHVTSGLLAVFLPGAAPL